MSGGGRLIANLLALVPLRTPVLNSDPFPPPELPGFAGTIGLSVTPGGPACPSWASGWRSRPPPPGASRVVLGLRLPACRRHYPEGDHWADVASRESPPRDPVTAAFLVMLAGRLPRHFFRGLLGVHSRYGLPDRGTKPPAAQGSKEKPIAVILIPSFRSDGLSTNAFLKLTKTESLPSLETASSAPASTSLPIN